MLNRRDVWLGLFLLASLAGIVVIALMVLALLSVDGISISPKSVAIIEITGPIIGSSSVVDKLDRYMKNDNVPAVVIRLNTPGGGVVASQEIYETVLKVRQTGKKVIASMDAVAASGGYYIAVACDSVVANPGTITGSIGVIINLADFSELYQKIGIDFSARKSGKFKDMGSSARKMTDEEKALLDSVVMDTYEQFVQAVSIGRNMDPDQVRPYADGRIFTGRQAKELGFVDELGTYQDAIDLAGIISGLGKNPPILKEKRDFFEDFVLGGISKIQRFVMEQSIPRLLYIMQ
ncbi:MAG: signal peptide peptidase SppA [Candidatus Latescibacteria bacterium]|nr:signal peptide peptidase SppA [Candidatus Latescibacterota bacterium]